ncbi:outer membrane protein assembly factor BamA [Alphaproteobacteria bacterium]|nr:outer membrane protein assembly factor BamA [Alphaproteobacteria bacterium]
MYRKFFFLIFFYFIFQNVSAKPLTIGGLSKYTLNDIQSITSVDIYNNNLELIDIDLLIKELTLSDLIYELDFEEFNDSFFIKLYESNIIENIFINNNVWIKDDVIKQNLASQTNFFLNKNNIKNDLEIIKTIYKSNGFQNISIISKVEKYSDDRVNLIYEVTESKQQKIGLIKFIGNKSFSDKYLNSIIESQSIKFYNIFKSGSNLNYTVFDFDKNKIISSYKNEGFFDVRVSYLLEKSTFNNNILTFYIDEGYRTKIENIKFNFSDQLLNSLDNSIYELNKKIKNNNLYYDKNLIDQYLEIFNDNLVSSNIFNKSIEIELFQKQNYLLDIIFKTLPKEPIVINQIEITGNSITKSKTIRSKIFIEPGEYLNQFTLDKSMKTLNNYPYIKNVNVSKKISDQLVDINIDIEENKQTGNILLAGTFNADTGAGVTFSIEDQNIFGSGNSISSNFNLNSEDIKFDINYKQYPILNPNLTNTYSILNQDNDYTNSFGYKASRRGLGYFINFNQNDDLSYGAGINYETFKGHSPVNTTSQSINDNIGNFENFNLKFSLNYDTTDSYLNPTNGHTNKIDFIISPENISDSSFYKFVVTNKNYKKLEKSENYIFLNNKYGYAKSLNSKLKTINAFGLGGLNFKGFDYKGIGPYDGNIYLGGNEFFTSTIGYGSSFIFDDKDNINIKFFLTTGSIWNSDYASSSDIDLRTSIGSSFDFITAVGPISFSYAVPIQKNNSDKTRPFNFSIGTSF